IINVPSEDLSYHSALPFREFVMLTLTLLTVATSLLCISGRFMVFAGTSPIETPWATMELTDKDRISPWITYESCLVVGLHFTAAPTSVADALDPKNFRIQSDQDPSYADATMPLSVSFRSRVMFAALSVSPNYRNPLRFGRHAFLQLPTPLRNGMLYRVTVAAAAFGYEVSFNLTVNDTTQLNTNIRVNQVGYSLSGPKLGYVGSWLGSSTATSPYMHVALQLPYGNASDFAVQDAATGAVVFTGTPRLFIPVVTTAKPTSPESPDLYTGQRVWQLDFSSLSIPGRYVLHVPGLGLSHAFRVATDALRPALGALARGTYGQRCGVALSWRYLGPWGATRPEACHMPDAEVMPLDPAPSWFTSRLPLPNPTPNLTTLPPVNASYFLPSLPGGSRIVTVGGHHDAGDYGKYTVSSGLMVGWLMISLEVMGADQDDLPLPEAGDGVPDILQEVEWELKFLEGMQDTDGGVYCVVKPNTTAGDYYEGTLPCGTPGLDSCNLAADSPRRGPRIAWPKDTTCTAQFAAVMARVARSPLFRRFRPAAVERYLARARAAWDFLTRVAPFGALCYHHYGCLGLVTAAEAVRPVHEHAYNCYDPQGDQSADERLWAAIELYGATGEAAFHDYFVNRHCPRYRRWGWQALPFSYGPATITYAELAVKARNGARGALPVNATVAQRCLDELAVVARGHIAEAKTNPYGLALPVDVCRTFGYGWHFPAEPAAHLMVAAALAASNSSEATAWRNLAAQQVHYMLGANPQGFSLISGIGARRIRNVVDQESSYDDLDPAWPGLPIGLASTFTWLSQYGSSLGWTFPPGIDYPALHRISDVFNVNTEFAVHWLAMSLGVVAALAGNASTPGQPGSSALSPPVLSLEQSISSGPAPLSVQFTAKVEGDPGAVAYVEYDFGDGGHSYQAQPVHVYGEAGRAFYGTLTVVFIDGQVATQPFSVFTSWMAEALPLLPAPTGMSLAARLGHNVPQSGWGASLPPLYIAATLTEGPDAVGAARFAGTATAGASTSSDNLAWQGPQASWHGAALRFYRFEDAVNYSLTAAAGSGTATVSTNAVQSLLAASWGGLVLEAWVYVAKYLSYGRGNVFMMGLRQGKDRYFGLQSSIWTGMQVVMGKTVVANDTQLGSRLTAGRWHHVRLAASPDLDSAVAPPGGSPGACSVWVDGELAARMSGTGCSSQTILDYCGSTAMDLRLVAGSFNGYIDGLCIYGSPTVPSLASLCGPRPPPPSPPRPPPSPAPDNRFYPLAPDRATLAVLDSDTACFFAGEALISSLPLRMYSEGASTGTSLLPSESSFLAGLSAAPDGLLPNITTLNSTTTSTTTVISPTEVGNRRWMRQPTGCSLRIGSQAIRAGGAALGWRLPAATLAAARSSSAFSLDAKIFIESWRTSYSYWSSEIFGFTVNWDTYFKMTFDIWTNAKVLLSTPAAATTGGFSGVLLNSSRLEAVLPAGCWHHVALTANESGCAVAVDSVEVVSTGGCNVTRLLPAGAGISLNVGGIRGWMDELQLSSVWRPTQRPGGSVWPTLLPLPTPPPPSPSPSLSPPPPSPSPLSPSPPRLPSPSSSPQPPSPSPPPALVFSPSPRPSSPPPSPFPPSPALLSPPPPPPSPRPSPLPPAPALVDSSTLLLLGPDASNCPTPTAPSALPQPQAQANGSAALAAQQYTSGTPSDWLPVNQVGGPVLLMPLGGAYQVPSFGGHMSSCSVAFNHSACGSCAYVRYNLSMAAVAPIKISGAMTVDAKLWVTKWVNYGIDNSDSVLGWFQAWDRYFKLTSDKYQMVGALVKAPSTFTTQQGLYADKFVNWTTISAAMTLNTWHHVALAINTTTCALYVDGALLNSPVRCNVTAMVNFATWSTLAVGGFQGMVADLRLSSSWVAPEGPVAIST
ncbi:hypothetical protein Vretifemale_18404, partial [Volvox reticuliferus]